MPDSIKPKKRFDIKRGLNPAVSEASRSVSDDGKSTKDQQASRVNPVKKEDDGDAEARRTQRLQESTTPRAGAEREADKQKAIREAVASNAAEYEKRLDASKKGIASLESQLTKVTQIYLPVSKKSIDAKIVEIDPRAIKVSLHNKRIQSLLNMNDPDLVDMAESLKIHQDNAILVRNIPDGYELVYGSRRLFCANHINFEREQGEIKSEPFKLIALIADIPDLDVEGLSDNENDRRTDISVYERAIHMATLKKDKKLSDDKIGKLFNVFERSVRNSLLLSTLDIEFVKLLPSPKAVLLNQGLQMIKIINQSDADRCAQFLTNNNGIVFDTMKDLKNAFKSFVDAPSESKKSSRAPKLFNKEGHLKAKFSKNRNNEGQYKIDVFNISDDEHAEIESFLTNLSSPNSDNVS